VNTIAAAEVAAAKMPNLLAIEFRNKPECEQLYKALLICVFGC